MAPSQSSWALGNCGRCPSDSAGLGAGSSTAQDEICSGTCKSLALMKLLSKNKLVSFLLYLNLEISLEFNASYLDSL